MGQNRPVSFRSALFLSALTLAAAALRGWGLTDFAITHWDEGLVWRGAQYFLTLAQEGHYSPTHGPPLVSAGMAALARLAGRDPAVAVLWNLVLGSGLVPLSYWVGCRIASARVGWVAAVLIAASGLHLVFARSLLTETTYAFFLLASLGLSATALERPRPVWLLATGLAVACTQATKYNGFLAAAPLAILLTVRFARAPEGGIALFALRLALLCAPAALVIAGNLAAIAAMADLSAFIEHYAGYVGSAAPPLEILGTLAFVLPWTVLALVPLGLLHGGAARERLWLLHLTLALYALFLFRYAFFLRLMVPVATLLILYAALGIDALAGRLATRWRPAHWVVSIGLIGLALLQTGLRWERFFISRFDGYSSASAFLVDPVQSAGDRARLIAGQDFVWEELGGEAPVFGLPSQGASAILATSREVDLIVDVGAFSRLRPWDLEPIFEELRERYLLERFPATLNLDALQNNLTLGELQRLGTDEALRERVLWIHVFRLPSRELERLVAERL